MKKCFIYNKSYWSSKYTNKECEDSAKNKFKEWFFWEFDKQVSQYIAEHEKVDHKMDDDTKSINDAVEALMINVGFLSPSPFDQDNINIDTFIISFGTGTFKKERMFNNE